MAQTTVRLRAVRDFASTLLAVDVQAGQEIEVSVRIAGLLLAGAPDVFEVIGLPPVKVKRARVTNRAIMDAPVDK